MNRFILIAGALIIFGNVCAQEKKNKLWVLPEMGIQLGATEPSLDFRIQGGIQRGSWLYGAGAAVDFYRFTSIPTYVQVRRLFKFRGTTPFLLASAGYNFKNSADTVPTWFGSRVYDRTGGLYGEIGGGFVFRIFKKERLSLSVAKSIKQVKESYDIDFWLGPGQTRAARSTDLYTMHRVVVRLGWKF
jgi:hypothetical protein